MGRKGPFSKLASVWCGPFDSWNLDYHLVVESNAIGITLKKSSIRHLTAGREVYAGLPIGKKVWCNSTPGTWFMNL